MLVSSCLWSILIGNLKSEKNDFNVDASIHLSAQQLCVDMPSLKRAPPDLWVIIFWSILFICLLHIATNFVLVIDPYIVASSLLFHIYVHPAS